MRSYTVHGIAFLLIAGNLEAGVFPDAAKHIELSDSFKQERQAGRQNEDR